MKRGLPRRFLGVVALILTTSTPHNARCQIPPRLDQPTLTNGVFQFLLSGEADITYVIESSPDLQNWTALVTNSDCASVRSIAHVVGADATYYRALGRARQFTGAGLSVRRAIDANGYSLMSDSFDSSDPLHSTNGFYYFPWRKAGGDLAAELGLTNVGNATIYGKLLTGPSASISIGGGQVGDLTWPGPGIEPCWWINNYVFRMPDVPAPFASGFPIPALNATNTYFMTGGNYFVNGDLVINNNETMYVAGVVNLYVTGNFVMKAQNGSIISIAPGATLTLYVGTTTGQPVSTELTMVLSAGNVSSFQYYGLPSNTTVTWTGNVSYLGLIYAPEATFIPGGSGTKYYDYQGACVADSVVLNGNFNFHYDENLSRVRAMR